jgi:Flp pilus assembly CpaE family ATPase
MDAEQAREDHAVVMVYIMRMLCAGIVHGDLSEFNVLVDEYGPVIIDLPQAWTSWSHAVLDQSDIIVPVLKPNVENVHNAQKILIGLEHMKISKEKAILVVNQVAKGLTHTDRIAQIKKITKRPIVQIREDQKTNISARDRGMLLAEVSTSSAAVKDILSGKDAIIKHLNSLQGGSAPTAAVNNDLQEEQLTG